jgi:hypothetical protein
MGMRSKVTITMMSEAGLGRGVARMLGVRVGVSALCSPSFFSFFGVDGN